MNIAVNEPRGLGAPVMDTLSKTCCSLGGEAENSVLDSTSNRMSKPNSVTQWIEDLKQGDEEAAARLWDRYFGKMVEAARKKLARHALAVADEEDVALSAFDSL